MRSLRSTLSVGLTACVLCLLAAGTTRAEDGAVKGTVTVDGKPLAAGRVRFHLDNGQIVGAKVKDGAFAVDRVPAGEYRVMVEGRGVPAIYASEDTTPLKTAIQAGENDLLNLELRGARPVPAKAPQVGDVPKGSKLHELLKERVAALKEIAAQVETTYRAGRAAVEEVYQARRAVLQAELDLSESDKEQLAVLEELLALAKKQEEQASARTKSGTVPPGDVLRARVNRLEAEIALERARGRPRR